ncbi:MAG: invasion associated locus B family protein [Hyphomicrobiaceae bacterium]
MTCDWGGLRPWLRLAALLGVLGLCGATGPALAGDDATAAQDPSAVKAQHGDWQLVCKRPEGAKSDLCALVQDVTSESNPNIGLSVQFQKSAEGEKVLRVFAPLGVLLPPGLGLQIDDDKVGHAPFVRCQVVGCVAQVTLDKDLIAKFKAGKTAWFIVFQTKEAGIGIPVSLDGFPKAIDSLP